MTTQQPMIWFRSVPGRAVRRFGTDGYVGATLGPGGFEFSGEPCGISQQEHVRFRREYNNAERRGDLVRLGEEESAAADEALLEATTAPAAGD